MLARGLLCRLATADVPKTPAHELPQLARLLQRSLLSRNASANPAICALSRAYNAAVINSRRSYATTTRATQPTKTVKKDVKKAAAKKKPAAGKTTARKTTAKKTASKKTTAKKTPAVKKPKKKVAKPKRVLTPEEKQKKLIATLRKTALKAPSNSKTLSAWQTYAAEALKSSSSLSASQQGLKDAAARYNNFSASEKEHYNHLASEKNEANAEALEAWVKSHTVDEIRLANNARRRLRLLLSKTLKGKPSNTSIIPDERQLRRPIQPFALFTADRHKSGDFKGIDIRESARLISQEWKALSAGEKKPYQDTFSAEKARLERERSTSS